MGCCTRLTTWPNLCRGTPVLDEALMNSYQPEVAEMWDGRKMVKSPDTPYAAACAQNAIYFIDQRFDLESAKHIKEQLEHLVPDQNGYFFIDEVDATAERRDAAGKPLFTFNPAYARVFFADSMNGRNPSLSLPIHEPAGDWLVVYDVRNAAIGDRAKRIGTGLNPRDSTTNSIPRNKEDKEYDACNQSPWKAAVDTPRFEDETDADYYQRMDKLHWG